ncbi:FAD-dependent oxidoreductase [Acrocarpospora phusangensis]|uniref:FAD-dependent oxidoreductase n=1 Tax=Acrocarpospora phusangensis TaxID=1070424 RepID=A0A919QAP8_9ACTN|nr:FAD-dependent monooxygenase [Acrocarpospora phusangensis]GIH24561.1 FAD-dependent oxidoreductase [Acrocarpospora phusangensis]
MTTTRTNTNILISGASVAGPALAYWLRRHGFTVTVVERATALRDGGYAVDFRGDVQLSLLRRMGILADVEREQTHMGDMSYVNAAGKKVATMPSVASGDLEIFRGDLARILYDATKDDTEYLFGDSITALTEDDEGVWVTFERAAPRRYDLVVGADGLHSNVRALAFGPDRDAIEHLGLYCAVFTMDNHLGLDHAGLTYVVPGKVVCVYSARHNTEAKAMFFFGSPPFPYDRHDTGRQKKIVAEVFDGIGWETPRLLDAMGKDPDFYFDSVSQVHLDSWSRGRVVLLGDAAHSPSLLSGMGTGLAMVGAYVLAGELAAAGGDHQAGFAGYEEAMRDYVAGCQRAGQGIAKWMVPTSRFMIWFINLNYRLLSCLPWKGLMARAMINAARGTAGAITLKPYDSALGVGPPM